MDVAHHLESMVDLEGLTAVDKMEKQVELVSQSDLRCERVM